MNVHEFLNTYLGGNKNVSTLTYDALAEMLTDYAKTLQLQQTGVSISLERAKKYARHQYYLGTQQCEFVEFEDWAKD
jgi:hypothetical protein